MYAKVDTSVTNNYVHNPYVEEFEESRPILNPNNGDSITNTDEQWTAIQIYPNPASEELRFHNVHQKTKITIYDMMGQVMHLGLITEQEASLDVSSYSVGMYIVEFSNDQNEVKREIIVITK